MEKRSSIKPNKKVNDYLTKIVKKDRFATINGLGNELMWEAIMIRKNKTSR